MVNRKQQRLFPSDRRVLQAADRFVRVLIDELPDCAERSTAIMHARHAVSDALRCVPVIICEGEHVDAKEA